MSDTNELYDKRSTKNSEVSFLSVARATMMERTIIRKLINNKIKFNLFVLVENLDIELYICMPDAFFCYVDLFLK